MPAGPHIAPRDSFVNGTPYWDIRTTVDLIGDGDPHDPLPARDLNALEAHVTRALRALA